MLTKDAITFALKLSDQAVMSLIDDMRDAPLTQPTTSGGNHPLWILGHLTWVEGMTRQVLYGEKSLIEEWTPIFGNGSTPVTDASKYPSFAEARAKYDELWQANMRLFESFSEADLDKPTKWQPPGLEQAMATYGLTFLTLALHKMSHRGQVADARRAAGRKALMM